MVLSLDPQRSPPAMVLAAQLELSAEAQAVPSRSGTARAYLDELILQGLLQDAVALMCRLLPRQYCLAWAADCVRTDLAAMPSPDRDEWARFAACDRYLRAPSEEARAVCADLAERANFKTAAAWLAAGVGWTGGSLAPPHVDVVAPPETLTATACGACVTLLAARVPAQMPDRLREYLARAITMFGAPIGGGR